ncbi:protease, partial [Streptomyces sp. SID4985]|nr:protease [Streptomyces sp. SID4985]
MSTENEGNAVPPAPSAPPVPVDAPPASAQGAVSDGGAPTTPLPPLPQGLPGAAGQAPGPASAEGPQAHGQGP